MLSTTECKRHLSGISLSEEQVVCLRDSLYALVENVLDDYLANVDLCKKH